MQGIVGVHIAVGVGGGAVLVFHHILPPLNRQGAGNGFALIVGHIQAAVLAHAVHNLLKIAFRSGGEVVPLPGLPHNAYKVVQRLGAHHFYFHAFLWRFADSVSVIRLKGEHQLLLVEAVVVKAVNKPGLHILKIHTPRVQFYKALVQQMLLVGLVLHGDLRVDFNTVAVVFLCNIQKCGKERVKGGKIIFVRHKAAAAVKQGGFDHRHGTNQHIGAALNVAVLVPQHHGFPLPGGLDLSPLGGVLEQALGVLFDKRFILV